MCDATVWNYLTHSAGVGDRMSMPIFNNDGYQGGAGARAGLNDQAKILLAVNDLLHERGYDRQRRGRDRGSNRERRGRRKTGIVARKGGKGLDALKAAGCTVDAYALSNGFTVEAPRRRLRATPRRRRPQLKDAFAQILVDVPSEGAAGQERR